jgi:hypothetical protein
MRKQGSKIPGFEGSRDPVKANNDSPLHEVKPFSALEPCSYFIKIRPKRRVI